MYETKMIKVCFPGWRYYIPSLVVNLLVLAILPLGALIYPNQAIAQAPKKESNRQQAANTSSAPNALEPRILAEINRVRTNPQGYAQWLEKQRQYYDGIWLRLPGEKETRTNKGRKVLEEAIAFLKQQQPLPPLKKSDQASATASLELENFASANNIQYFSYGRKTAMGIVMGLVVDELFPDRRRRLNLLSPDAENTGVVCKSDPRYAKVCAIAYSDQAATTNVAEAKPESTVTPNRDTTVTVPERITTPEPIKPPEVATAPLPENRNPVADVPEDINTPETTPSPDKTVPEAKPEAVTTTPVPENSDTDTTATLPVPPPLEAPPTPAKTTAEEPPTGTAADLTEDPAETANKDKSEAEDIIVAEEQELEAEPETESAETEEVEAEIAEIIDDESESVATNSSIDRLLEKVERGSLENGDRIIEEDGSLYDFYPLEGKAGESFNIYLESDDFDAFVALVDSKGNTIKENDDISESDSNSRIRVTLPEDGTYNVIVNTYDEKGTGRYVLTVSR